MFRKLVAYFCIIFMFYLDLFNFLNTNTYKTIDNFSVIFEKPKNDALAFARATLLVSIIFFEIFASFN
jgi:hypothetical protein